MLYRLCVRTPNVRAPLLRNCCHFLSARNKWVEVTVGHGTDGCGALGAVGLGGRTKIDGNIFAAGGIVMLQIVELERKSREMGFGI